MWKTIKEFLTEIVEHTPLSARLLFLCFLIISGWCAISAYRDDPAFYQNQVLFYSISLTFYAAAVVPAVIILGRYRHKYVAHVALLALVSLFVVVSAFYLYYFALIPANQTKYERILNLPPVLAGAWAAALGWYIHHQLTLKIHRTNHAVSFAMQTRTNQAYLTNLANLRLVYATKDVIQKTDEPYFPASKRIDVENQLRYLAAEEVKVKYRLDLLSLQEAAKANQDSAIGGKIVVTGTGKSSAEKAGLYHQLVSIADRRLALETECKRCQAIEGLRFILNFYEFMAYGISAGDLDGDILLKTIGASVINFYRTSVNYRQYLVEGTNQPLAYESLAKLIDGGGTGRFDADNGDGWAKRLNVAAASGHWDS